METANPTALPIAQIVQCVALCGGGFWVKRITSLTFSSDVLGVPGGRVFSRSKPSTPSIMNRSCQRQTQVLDLDVAAMIDVVPAPSALRSTMRQRQTCFYGEDGFEITVSSRDLSSLETLNDIPVRIRVTRTANTETEPQFGLRRPA
jgi:hypothetical protein